MASTDGDLVQDRFGVDLNRLNYIPKVPFNGTDGAGGNPETDNLNLWYEVGNQAGVATPLGRTGF